MICRKLKQRGNIIEKSLSLIFDSVSSLLKGFDAIIKGNSLVKRLKSNIEKEKKAAQTALDQVHYLKKELEAEKSKYSDLKISMHVILCLYFQKMIINEDKSQQLFQIQQRLANSVIKTNIKGYKEYSREQIKVMKGMVKSIKDLQSQKEFEVEDSKLKYELLEDKYTIVFFLFINLGFKRRL